jgi:hypothetical protein
MDVGLGRRKRAARDKMADQTIVGEIEEAISEIRKELPDLADHLRRYILVSLDGRILKYDPPPDTPKWMVDYGDSLNP